MTPKEKAQELVNKYLLEVRGADRYGYNLESMNLFIAKQCAIIAVEECMQCAYSMYDKGFEHSKEYWNEVKTEIEKL